MAYLKADANSSHQLISFLKLDIALLERSLSDTLAGNDGYRSFYTSTIGNGGNSWTANDLFKILCTLRKNEENREKIEALQTTYTDETLRILLFLNNHRDGKYYVKPTNAEIDTLIRYQKNKIKLIEELAHIK